MARARNLKPGFFKNEDLAECSAFARLCFAGLWTLADREGRLEDRPKRIKGELFAFDSIEVEPLLSELARFRFIVRYVADDGRPVIQVTEFAKHQNPHHREPPSDLPPPPSPGLDQDGKPPKPKAVDASHDAEASDKPQASPGLAPPSSDMPRGSSRAESGTLIPEQGIRNPPTPSSPAAASEVAGSAAPGTADAGGVGGQGIDAGTGDPDARRAPDLPHQPPPGAAGVICRALGKAGISRTNPGHPTLLALIAAGATAEELLPLVDQAKGKADPFAYLLTVAVKQRERAADVAQSLAGTKPPAAAAALPDPASWRSSPEGVQRMANQLGMGGPRDAEAWVAYEARVLRVWRSQGSPEPTTTKAAA